MLSKNDYYGVSRLKELLQNLQNYFYGNDGRDHFTLIERNCNIT